MPRPGHVLRLTHFFLNGLREKPRLALAVGLGVFAASAAWTFTRPKIYEATATVFFLEPRDGFAANKAGNDRILDYSGRLPYLTPLLGIAAGDPLAKRVAAQLIADEGQAILLPHNQAADPENLLNCLKTGRRVIPYPLSGAIRIAYRDRSPAIATRVSGLFAQELRQWAEDALIKNLKNSAQELDREIEQQRQRVTDLEREESHPETEASIELTVSRGRLADLLRRQAWFAEEIPYVSGRHVLPLDRSLPPAPDAFVEPTIPRNLGAGLLAGLALGVTAAAFAARWKPTSAPAASTAP